MAINLLGLLAVGAAGAYVGSNYESLKRKAIEEAAARQQVLNQAATELVQGRNYGVVFMLDPRSPQWGGVRDLAQAQTLITATLQSPSAVGGWLLGAPAAPVDDANRKLFLAGQPSQWAFMARWTRPEKFITQKPDWITMAVPFLLPAG